MPYRSGAVRPIREQRHCKKQQHLDEVEQGVIQATERQPTACFALERGRLRVGVKGGGEGREEGPKDLNQRQGQAQHGHSQQSPWTAPEQQ